MIVIKALSCVRVNIMASKADALSASLLFYDNDNKEILGTM